MEKRFYNFKIGTEWIFNADFDGVKRMVVFKVVNQDSNGTHFEYDIYNPPNPGATASLDEIWYIKDGYVVWADYDLERVTPYWYLYKLGSHRGDTWKGPSEMCEATHMGTTELTVPAGRYKDVIHIRLTDEDSKTHDFYYAPNVGLVKWDTISNSGKSVLELQTFKSAQQRISKDWLPYVDMTGCFWFWAPQELIIVTPLSKGSCFALASQTRDILLEVFVFDFTHARQPAKKNPTAFAENSLKRSLVDKIDLHIIREGPYQLEEIDERDAVLRMSSFPPLKEYEYIPSMRRANTCRRLILEYKDHMVVFIDGDLHPHDSNIIVQTVTDSFCMQGDDIVLVLNLKTISSEYSARVRIFELIAASARIGRIV